MTRRGRSELCTYEEPQCFGMAEQGECACLTEPGPHNLDVNHVLLRMSRRLALIEKELAKDRAARTPSRADLDRPMDDGVKPPAAQGEVKP